MGKRKRGINLKSLTSFSSKRRDNLKGCNWMMDDIEMRSNSRSMEFLFMYDSPFVDKMGLNGGWMDIWYRR